MVGAMLCNITGILRNKKSIDFLIVQVQFIPKHFLRQSEIFIRKDKFFNQYFLSKNLSTLFQYILLFSDKGGLRVLF